MSNVAQLRKAPVTPVRYLSPADVCELVPGMTVANLQELRKRGKGPRYAKPTAKTVVYVEADVHAWVQATFVSPRA
ncbi:helix-turn-helix transcriptional regulator [Microbacterium sp. NPDC078428]|uniref:helix-turn-helix transcriptional regulator n=1 Tax=Microbacterium sp. NPDC078428 TaxID=3364190 RepID=UPI0037CAE869